MRVESVGVAVLEAVLDGGAAELAATWSAEGADLKAPVHLVGDDLTVEEALDYAECLACLGQSDAAIEVAAEAYVAAWEVAERLAA